MSGKSSTILAAIIVAATSDAVAQPAPGEPAPVPDQPEPEPLTDDDLLARSQADAEVIEVWDERPEKPFDRDTELRLSGEELARRGATDLATALALLPDVTVRDAGRGGFIADIRGARKGAVRILIDGVAVSDPFYGTFDVSTIPITDIVEIRVSTAPASPIDGPGGPGGVIEVHTHDAVGARLVVARLTGDTLPTFGASATGRTELAEHLALRLSTSATFGMHDFDTATGGTIGEGRRATTGATRLEYRRGGRRAVLDGFVDDRHYLSPPSDDLATNAFLLIDRELTGRVGVGYDDDVGADKKLQLQLRGWVHAMKRDSLSYDDPELSVLRSAEDLFAMRSGGMALVTRPIGKLARWIGSLTVDHERARVETTGGGAVTVTKGDATIIQPAVGGQLEKGRFEAAAAVGVALPLGFDADPWPEAKLTATFDVIDELELQAIAARKGRVPSLRERYQGTAANETLGPEHANHAEVRATVRPIAEAEIVVAPYYRISTGMVKLDLGTSLLTNLGELHVRGVDSSAKVKVIERVEVGGSYTYADAHSDDLCGGEPACDPLDFLPHHKADWWTRIAPIDRVTVMARGRYVGRAVDRMMTTPAHVIWEVTATAQLAGDWLAVARCEDILDVRPETRGGYHSAGRVVSLIVQGTWE